MEGDDNTSAVVSGDNQSSDRKTPACLPEPRRRLSDHKTMMRLVGNLWCFLFALLLSAASADGQVINSFSPLFASPGAIVVLQGSGFTGPLVTAVQFANGKSAVFTVTSDTQISATVPVGAVSGPIGVLKSGNLIFSLEQLT